MSLRESLLLQKQKKMHNQIGRMLKILFYFSSASTTTIRWLTMSRMTCCCNSQRAAKCQQTVDKQPVCCLKFFFFLQNFHFEFCHFFILVFRPIIFFRWCHKLATVFCTHCLAVVAVAISYKISNFLTATNGGRAKRVTD